MRLLKIFVCLAAFFPAAPAGANPVDAFGLGSRLGAMGGAGAAAVEGAAANYYNPAALVRGRDLEIDLGYQAAMPRLELGGRDSRVDGTQGLVAAVAVPGPVGPLRLAFGVGIFLPDDRVTRVRALAYSQPRWVAYDNRTQRIFLAAHLAVQIVPGLYLGGGLAFMSRTEGTVGLKGRIAISDPDEQSSLVTSIAVDLVAIRYPQLGLLWEPRPWLRLGLVYRHSFLLQLDQGFTVRGDVGNEGLEPIVRGGTLGARSVSSDLFQPWQLALGGVVKPTRRLLVAYEIAFVRWSEFPTPASTLTVELDIGERLNPLVKIPPPRVYDQPGFRDLLVPRLGLEWRAVDRPRLGLDLRAGYAYEPSPVPDQTGETNYVDADKHRLSGGAGLEALPFPRVWPRPLGIDLHAAVTVLSSRATRKLDPLDAVGDYVARGWIGELGVTTRWRF